MQQRGKILEAFGADERVKSELLEYNINVYDHSEVSKLRFQKTPRKFRRPSHLPRKTQKGNG